MEVKIRTIGVFILMGFLFFATGCAGKGEEEGLITVDPESAVVTLGDSRPFSASPSDVPVTWSVNGILGGNEGTVGTVVGDPDTNTGLYTAPSDAAKAPESVRIRATPSSGPSGSAIAFLTTFGSSKRLSTHYAAGTARANTYSAGQKSIAVFKEVDTGDINLYVVWADNFQGLSRVWFTKSGDGGDNFDSPVSIDGVLFANQVSPAVTVDPSGNVFVVWEDYSEGDADIFIRKYDGSGFGSLSKVNLGIDTGVVDYDTTPSVAINSTGDIYVVWEHRSDATDDYPDIYFAVSTNQGQTFSLPTPIATFGRRPAIAIDAFDIAYVVWEDLSGFPLLSPTRILISRIDGSVPSSPREVDSLLSSNYHSRFPSVAIGPGGDVYVLWQRGLILTPGFDSEIVSAYDMDLARVEGTTLDVLGRTLSFPDDPNTGVFGGPAYPTITGDSSNVYIAWDDQRNGTKDIYFAKSSNGVTFTTNRIVNDNTGTWNEKPDIAVADGKAYVIWTDYRNTSLITTVSPNDVFFAREE